MMRLIDADKLCPDCMTKEGTLAISQSQIANAPTVDFEKLGESLRCQIRAEYGSCDDCELSCPRNELIKLLDLERPTGHWIKEECSLGKTYYCSECYAHPEVCFDFCPYCGADMRKEAEMTKLDKAKEIVKSCIEGARCGIFNTRNIAGDTLYTIYDEDGLTIDICKYYEYFEVFGLTDEEFDELKNYYYGLIEDCDERREEDA